MTPQPPASQSSRRRFLAATLAAGGGLVAAAPSAGATTGRRQWVDVPVPPDTTRHLLAVAAPTPRTAFAVGGHVWDQRDVTTALHWNGRAWRHEPVPPLQWNPYAGMDLAAATPVAAWVVGLDLQATRPMSLHWNGRGWNEVPYPMSGAALTAVAAEQGGTAWSVGSTGPGQDSALLRFERGRWVRKSLPVPPDGALATVAVSRAREVWVGGELQRGGVFTLLWDGRRWQRHDLPTSSRYPVMDILPISRTSVWMFTGDGGSNGSRSRLWHFDGTAWTKVANVPLGSFGDLLPYRGSIVSDGRGGIWIPGPSGTPNRSTYLHWDGSTWTRVHGPQRQGSPVDMNDLAPIPGTRSIWAVGHQGSVTTPIIERYTAPW